LIADGINTKKRTIAVQRENKARFPLPEFHADADDGTNKKITVNVPLLKGLWDYMI